MSHPRFTRGRGRLGSDRITTWLAIDYSATTTNGSAAISHVMTAVELAKRPFTVIRTHIEAFIQSDQAAASELQLNGIGLCVVSDQAVAVGVTAVPTPTTDLDSDLWFVHQPLLSNFLLGDGTGFSEPSGMRYSIDSKAARKVNDDEQIIIVQENSTVGSGATVLMAGRLLIKEA